MEQDLKLIENIDEALAHLKNKEILLLYESNHPCYFFIKKDKIIVLDMNAKYALSYDDFLVLYQKNKFVIFENKEEEFDSSIDDQYYSWKHK